MKQKNTNISLQKLFIYIAIAFTIFVIIAMTNLTDNTNNFSSVIPKENQITTSGNNTSHVESGIESNDSIANSPSLTLLITSRSLSGTEVMDNLELTENNELIVTPGIVDLFDYFLFASGELPNEVIELGTRDYLKSRLPQPALSQALDIYEDYLSYIEAQEIINENAMTNLDPAGIHTIDPFEALTQGATAQQEMLSHLTQSLSQIKQMRRTYINKDVVDALWAEDERYDDYTLARVAIIADQDLSKEERQIALAEHEKTLPALLRKTNEAPVRHNNVASSVTGNITPEDAYQENTERYGYEAANRLVALQEKRKLFTQQYGVYRQEKVLIDNSGLSGQDKISAIEHLRSRHFDIREVSRVAVQDRIGYTSSGGAVHTGLSPYAGTIHATSN